MKFITVIGIILTITAFVNHGEANALRRFGRRSAASIPTCKSNEVTALGSDGKAYGWENGKSCLIIQNDKIGQPAEGSNTGKRIVGQIGGGIGRPTRGESGLDRSASNATVQCDCSNGRSWAINNSCFCGAEADKIENCVRKIAPNWPFADKEKPDRSKAPSKCSSSLQDPAGFMACIDDQVPKSLDNSDQIVQDCVSSTNAVPENRSK